MGDGEIFGKFLKIFEEISGKFRGKHGVIRKREIKIMKRQNKILTHGLHENESTIMTDSPVQYLRNGNFHSNVPFLPEFTSLRDRSCG